MKFEVTLYFYNYKDGKRTDNIKHVKTLHVSEDELFEIASKQYQKDWGDADYNFENVEVSIR